MLQIDGSRGEGGGQILRTSLTLSMITGRPLQIQQIRAQRAKPGLMRQHLTAVKAAAEVCGAETEGAELGSRTLTFRPGAVQAGQYSFDIGTAGSASLVLQTILPPLMIAGGASQLTLRGGTHNMHAPPFDFLAKAFLPLLARIGPRVQATLLRHGGFYPAGSGEVFFASSPASKPIRSNWSTPDRPLRHPGQRPSSRGCRCISPSASWETIAGKLAGQAPGRRPTWSAARDPGNTVMIEIERPEVTGCSPVWPAGRAGGRGRRRGCGRGCSLSAAGAGRRARDQAPLALGARRRRPYPCDRSTPARDD